MKTDIITRTVLSADQGMILTDGEHYGKVFVLAENRSADEFSEITESEYERVLEEQAENDSEEG